MGATLDADSFLDRLEELEDRAQNPQPAMARVGDELRRQMASGGIPTATGRLKASLTDASHPDHIFELTAKGLRFGSKDPAARYNGKAIPRVDSRRVAEILARYILRGER